MLDAVRLAFVAALAFWAWRVSKAPATETEATERILARTREKSPVGSGYFFEMLERSVREFDAAYAMTFRYDKAVASPGSAVVEHMFSVRYDVLHAVGQIRMRLPNDAAVERDFAAAAEKMDRMMMECIDEARGRLGTFVHPGPRTFSSTFRAYDPSNHAAHATIDSN